MTETPPEDTTVPAPSPLAVDEPQFDEIWGVWMLSPAGNLTQLPLDRALRLAEQGGSFGNYVFFYANLEMPQEI